MVSRTNNLRKSDLELHPCLLRVLLDIDNRPADRVEERSIFFFRGERRVEGARLALLAFRETRLYPGRKVGRGLLERRGVYWFEFSRQLEIVECDYVASLLSPSTAVDN